MFCRTNLSRTLVTAVFAAVFAPIVAPPTAHAGGLTLPAYGTESFGRAGASVVAVGGPDAIAINPAGLSRGHGTRILISAHLVDLSLSFSRRGSYDTSDQINAPWEGQPYETIEDATKPSKGIGNFQLIPLISVASDLGGVVPGLNVALGLYSPPSFPGRSLGAGYVMDDPNAPPPPNRFDVVEQDASIILPSLAVGYRAMEQLHVGARLSWGIAEVKAKRHVWGLPNFDEVTHNESVFRLEAKDTFIPTFGIGAIYRITPEIEVGANYSEQIGINAVGTGNSRPSANLQLGGMPVTIGPVDDAIARCNKGGTQEKLAACVDLALPRTATIGGRYVFRNSDNMEVGDVELDLNWENWGSVSDDVVVVDGVVNNAILLKDTVSRHGFRDTFGVRLGGAYQFPVGPGALTARGGVAYDTAAAKPGWARLDKDGTARATLAAGVSFRMSRFQIDLGGGTTLFGNADNEGTCNPSIAMRGCSGSGMDTPIGDRNGPDPISPTIVPESQFESPYNQGTIKTRYTVITMGVSTWF